MPIIAKENANGFKPAPAGVAVAVCCDVVDLGLIPNQFRDGKLQHKIKIVWQLADVDEETHKRPIVQQRYTLSLHEKAALRRDLESWRGRPFTVEERGGFDVEKVIGIPCLLNIVHHENKGNTYANVSAIMPVPKNTPRPTVEGYVRVQDRPKDQQREPGSDDGDGGFQATDDDVPF